MGIALREFVEEAEDGLGRDFEQIELLSSERSIHQRHDGITRNTNEEHQYTSGLGACVVAHGEGDATHGVTCLKEGTHTFTLQSGTTFTIYASPYTPNFGAAAFQYPMNNYRFNPSDCVPD